LTQFRATSGSPGWTRTNNPDKATQLHAAGIRVNSQVPTRLHLSPGNGRYLAAKAWRGHTFGGSYDDGVAGL